MIYDFYNKSINVCWQLAAYANMGNLDKKRKLEFELVSNKHLSNEEREELEKERLRILEKLRLKTLRNKKNRKARLQKAEQFMINHTLQRLMSRICYLSKQHLMINFFFFILQRSCCTC